MIRSVTNPLAYPVKTAFLDTSTLGSNAVVSAITNSKIIVLAVALVAGASNNVKFLSAANQISSTMALAANGGVVLPFHQYGWFSTNVGEALNINLSAATSVGVTITYIEG